MASNLVDHIGNKVTVSHVTGNMMESRDLITVDEFGITVRGANGQKVFVPWLKVNYIDLLEGDKKIGYSSTPPQT